jgi:outer membrane putative beta-barrel porin/alpha-amylase
MISLTTVSRGIVLLCGLSLASVCRAQDLSPRAYVITPVHWNAVILTYSFSDGSIFFDAALPITDATGRINVPIFSYYHAFSFFGRSANATASLPYAVGSFQGKVHGVEQNLYRSGLMDSVYRISVNLKGGPAMSLKEFSSWHQRLIVGASLKVVAPTGQYDPTKLVTPGANRWAFKPELGLSRRWGHWLLDGYGGVWLFTTNPEFFSHNRFTPGTNTLSQQPVGALEMHLSYDVTRRLWFSIDGNYWYGGSTSINGLKPASLQANSRIGGTASIPVSKHQSLKFSYSRGTVIRVGGNFQTLSLGWQYFWMGRPR